MVKKFSEFKLNEAIDTSVFTIKIPKKKYLFIILIIMNYLL